jgi:hypothetical protein
MITCPLPINCILATHLQREKITADNLPGRCKKLCLDDESTATVNLSHIPMPPESKISYNMPSRCNLHNMSIVFSTQLMLPKRAPKSTSVMSPNLQSYYKHFIGASLSLIVWTLCIKCQTATNTL